MDLFSDKKANQVRFRSILQSGALVDEVADVVETQIIANEAGASIRHPGEIPLYHITAEGRLDYQGGIACDTGHSPPPGTDSRYCNSDSLDFHRGIKSETVDVDQDSLFKSHRLTIIHYVVAVIIFAVCAGISGVCSTPDFMSTPDGAASDQEATTGGVSYEMVESLDGAEAGADGAEAASEGAGGR